MENHPRSTQRRIRYTNTTRALAWLMAVALAAAVVLLIASATAEAQTGVEIPLERVHRGDPGERFLEAEIGTTNEIGWTCGAFLERRNNSSIHEGTDLIITSGANGVTFANIESDAFEEAIHTFVVAGDIRVYTQLGEDGVTSMGFLLEFECHPPEDETTTTTTSTTVPGTTTTTEPPPIDGPDTGGGACAEGACDGWTLTPLQTWLLIGGIAWIVGTIVAWLFIAGGTRKQTPTR